VDVVLYLEVFFSFGERQHALSFARRIGRAGYRPRFVASPRIAEDLVGVGFDAVPFATPALGIEAVRKIDPGLVIACELFNLSPESIEGLAACGRPLATLDGTALGPEISADPFGMPEFRRALALPDRYLSLRCCPVHDVEPDAGDVFHWQLFSEAERLPRDATLWTSLGLDPARRTVLLPLAVWATHFAASDLPVFAGLRGYHARLRERVVAGLEAFGEEIQLVVVSDRRRATGGRGRVAVHDVGLLPHGLYDRLLRGCDALVSDNIIQASVVRAAVLGIPHLVVQSMAPSDLPWHTNIFPLRQIFPVQREWAGAVEVAEYGDPDGVRDALVAVLRRGFADEARRERRRAYLARLAGLAEPGEILARIVGPAARA
jgi:hypothetical protein